MIASRPSSIVGSGTLSQRISCLPCQVSAFMVDPFQPKMSELNLDLRHLFPSSWVARGCADTFRIRKGRAFQDHGTASSNGWIQPEKNACLRGCNLVGSGDGSLQLVLAIGLRSKAVRLLGRDDGSSVHTDRVPRPDQRSDGQCPSRNGRRSSMACGWNNLPSLGL